MEEAREFRKVGQLKEGNYVLIDGEPCRIRSIEKSKPGKHGSAKARVTAFGLFDDAKHTLLKPTGDDAEVPIVEKGIAQIVADLGDRFQLMDVASYETLFVKKREEAADLKPGSEAEYLRYGDKVRIARKRGTE